MEGAVRQTGAGGSGLGRPLAWSLAIHAAAVLLVVPSDPPPGRAESRRRISAQLLNANHQPTVRPPAILSPVAAQRFEAPTPMPANAIVMERSRVVAPASSRAVKPAAPQSAVVPAVGEASVAEPASSASLPAGRPLPSTALPALVVAESEAVRPDQILAENQYRLAIGLEARRFRRYPPLAREMGWEGTAEVWIALNPSLNAPSITLAKPSGHSVLDREAIALLSMVVGRVQVPSLLLDRKARVRVTIEYRLEE